MQVIKRASAMYRSAKRDVLNLYYSVYNTIVVDLPWVLKTFGQGTVNIADLISLSFK